MLAYPQDTVTHSLGDVPFGSDPAARQFEEGRWQQALPPFVFLGSPR